MSKDCRSPGPNWLAVIQCRFTRSKAATRTALITAAMAATTMAMRTWRLAVPSVEPVGTVDIRRVVVSDDDVGFKSVDGDVVLFTLRSVETFRKLKLVFDIHKICMNA